MMTTDYSPTAEIVVYAEQRTDACADMLCDSIGEPFYATQNSDQWCRGVWVRGETTARGFSRSLVGFVRRDDIVTSPVGRCVDDIDAWLKDGGSILASLEASEPRCARVRPLSCETSAHAVDMFRSWCGEGD